jgi:RNA polymerase sigma-70 factor (ECF subfamily)
VPPLALAGRRRAVHQRPHRRQVEVPAIARRYVAGPAAALAEVDELSDHLQGYHLFHAARAALLRELGRHAEAARADAAALALTKNSGERALLEGRLSGTKLT